jgi:alpha-tubulin suppressor-like RCC1 family protein
MCPLRCASHRALALLLLVILLGGCDVVNPGPESRAVTRPVLAAGGMRFATISSAWFHSCGIDLEGRAWCWGDNQYRQLGVSAPGQSCDRESSTCHFTPVAVETELRFQAISAGVTHTCALTAAGAAYCWGGGYSDGRGILGTGARTQSAQPVAVAGGHHFQSLSAGGRMTCAVSLDERGYCWGEGGHVGDGGSAEALVPVEVAGGLRFRQIAAGSTHVCGVTTEGALYCWGSNQYGELGTGSVGPAFGNAPSARAPVPSVSSRTFGPIAAGDMFNCGLSDGGEVICWGTNHAGQLGRTPPAQANPTPLPVTGSSGYTQVDAGGAHTCGLRSDGQAWCWGGNWFGSLGDGTDTASGSGDARATPAAVLTDRRFTALALGGSHSCGLTADGQAWCWGDRARGQMGNG